MNIDALYKRVTDAIIEAEALEANGSAAGARQAYLTVSFVEEEGAIARRGAVRAALRAGLPTRATELADRYRAEPDAPPELAEQLREMIARTSTVLESPVPSSVVVIPEARYRIDDEAA